MSSATAGTEGGAGSGVDPLVQRYFLRNITLLITENAGFVTAIAFVGMTTVMPTFVSLLGGSELLVGLIGTFQTAGWLLPQLLGARLVAGKPRVVPYMLAPLYYGRPAFLLAGVFVLLFGGAPRWLTLTVLFAALLLFYATDGLSTVPWYEFIGKAIPANRRGRMFGTAQLVGGAAGIGAGWIITVITGTPALRFPANYALLFIISGSIFILNIIPFLFVREPVDARLQTSIVESLSARRFLASLGRIVRSDARFVRLVGSRLLFGIALGTYPFYILFIDRSHSLGAEALGVFTASQVSGGLAGGFLIGWIADRFGTKSVMGLGTIVSGMIPAIALGMIAFSGSLGGRLLYPGIVIFFLMGVTGPVGLIGFASHLLETAPLPDRTTYMGLFNAMTSALLVVSPFAGWFLSVSSFTLLFLISLASSVVSLLVIVPLPGAPRGR